MTDVDARGLLARPNAMLWLDCSSGIAGDMLAAALLDLGASERAVRDAVESMALDGLEEIRVTRVSKHGLDACDFDVVLDETHETHDHDMAWLHGAAGGVPGHGPAEAHRHHHGHHHGHRTLADVSAVIGRARMSEHARDTALETFRILAEAEARAHGTTPDEVRFHEVGSVDSIVDVVAAAVCLDDLGTSRCVIESLAEGRGTVRCAHGIMPVPVPAVANIVMRQEIPLRRTDVEGELVTPTGASLAAAVRTDRSLPGNYAIRACGLGAGKRDYDCAGVLRALVVEDLSDMRGTPGCDADGRGGTGAGGRTPALVTKLECDIDDATGEALGTVIDELLGVGALEAHYLPVFTKKGRPAWQLQTICPHERTDAVEGVIFRQTTTIGIRRTTMRRTTLPREETVVETPLGDIRAKRVTLPDGSVRSYPEFDSVTALAEGAGIALQDAWQVAMGACAPRAGGGD